MAYDKSTGVLTIDNANETLDVILDNVATALGDYRVTEVAGVYARDVGLLCTSPNINKWAKYKPLDGFSKILLTEAERASVNYGLDYIPIYDSFSKMITDMSKGTTQRAINYDSTKTPWSYNIPKTGLFRISDFNNYYRNASLFFRSIECNNNSEILPDEYLMLVANAPDVNPKQIEPNDLSLYNGSTKLAMNYYGVGLFGANSVGIGKTFALTTSNINGVSIGGLSYTTTLRYDSFTVFGFLSTKEKVDITSESEGTFYVPIIPSKTTHSRAFATPTSGLNFDALYDIYPLDSGSSITGKNMTFTLSGKPNCNLTGTVRYTVENTLGNWATVEFNNVLIPASFRISDTESATLRVYIIIKASLNPTVTLETYWVDSNGNELTTYGRTQYTSSNYSGDFANGYGLYEAPSGVAQAKELTFDLNLFTRSGNNVSENGTRTFL